ncbi:hypothetical protein ACFY04_07180 [Streptomyces sp. NPDC001549]|uniref:hypothetical protein n=1 Tax=Streptomyces sp. NPDC001549 TaxID=3364586 RepID=UPI003674BAE1
MAKLTEEQKANRAAARARREALAAEEKDRRDAERREAWAREGTQLTWDEYKAGVSCRGCGEPMYDGLGSWPGLMYLSEEEKRDHEAMEERFRRLHPDCKSGRWGTGGSRVTHCCLCCPPPPLGPAQIEKLSRLFQSFPSAEERKKDLDAWELILTCDHVTTFIQHRENTYVRRVVDCPECQTRRGVVDSKRLGPAYTDEGVKAAWSEAEQARLAAELSKAKEQLRRQQQRAAATNNRIEELQKQLSPSAPGDGTA